MRRNWFKTLEDTIEAIVAGFGPRTSVLMIGRYNFDIMKLVTHEDTTIDYAEERRLFYAALTRTKNRVYIVAPRTYPSRFVIELIQDCEILFGLLQGVGGLSRNAQRSLWINRVLSFRGSFYSHYYRCGASLNRSMA